MALSVPDWAGARLCPLAPPKRETLHEEGCNSLVIEGAITVFFQVTKNLEVIFQEFNRFLALIFNTHLYSYFGCKTCRINSKVEPLS